MGTKQIRVSENLHARVRSENREGETLGETLERLIDDYTLMDFADDAAPAADAWDTAQLEEDLEEADRRNREALEEELP